MNIVKRQAWLREQFDSINKQFFNNSLPPTDIAITITPYGRAIADASGAMGRIRFHPQTRNHSQSAMWDILLHECIHINIDHNLGGHSNKRSSHQSIEWVNECNRLAPLLGLGHLRASLPKSKRIMVDGESKVRKVVLDECVPLKVLAGFPATWRNR